MYFVTICLAHLLVSTFANPFHKYPFVFLLDVGNEELEKANREQIRLSVPGGSLAIRYPAVGDGDTIAHVRVSGIDFGTDLKANIYDGGPGYKYVVLVFSGNAGVPYDAVVTLQTISDDDYDETQENETNGNEIDEKNDSAEDLGGDSVSEYSQKINTEIKQLKDNYYNKVQDKVYEDRNIVNKTDKNDKEHNSIYNPELGEDYILEDDTQENETENSNDLNERNEYDNSDSQEQAPVAQKYISEDYLNSDSDSDKIDQSTKLVKVDKNLYKKYKALMPHLFDPNVKIYPQDEELEKNESNSAHLDEDPVELDQMFNDEEIHNDAEKFKDFNNNNDNDGDSYYDLDDRTAVAY